MWPERGEQEPTLGLCQWATQAPSRLTQGIQSEAPLDGSQVRPWPPGPSAGSRGAARGLSAGPGGRARAEAGTPRAAGTGSAGGSMHSPPRWAPPRPPGRDRRPRTLFLEAGNPALLPCPLPAPLCWDLGSLGQGQSEGLTGRPVARGQRRPGRPPWGAVQPGRLEGAGV